MRIALFFFFFINLSSCFTPKKTSGLELDNIPNKIDTFLSNQLFNGVILVTKGNQTIYQKAIGFQDIETKSPLEINDPFFIGSISKQITAVLILKEVENGRIQLEDTIDRYLKELNQPWAKEITIHHLLTHTHGISKLDEPLVFEKGTKFKYSQLGYGLLANILEEVHNSSFKEIATDFFEKNGLKDTFHPKKLSGRKVVKGYEEGEDGQLYFAENSLVEYVAAGGFVSTTKDLNKWNQLLYNGKLLSRETLTLMQTKYATRNHPIFGDTAYGYGLLFKEGEQNVQIGALGYVPGFASACYFYPKTNINIIVLENTARDLNNFKNTFKVHTNIMDFVYKISQ